MKFSTRSSTKVMFLTTCRKRDIEKLPYISSNNSDFILESSMTIESFIEDFTKVIIAKKNKSR